MMEGDPLGLVESMMIAGFAVGASKGYIYLRSEYPLTHRILSKAIALAIALLIWGAKFGTSPS